MKFVRRPRVREPIALLCEFSDAGIGERLCDPLTGFNGCGMADNGHDITMPALLGSQNAEAVLSIMVRDALDEPGKSLLRLIFGRVFHPLNSRNAGPNVAARGQRNS
jgi:hypothetical protein